MKHSVAAIALAPLALAACSAPVQPAPDATVAGDATDLDATVAAFYAPYQREFDPRTDEADWDRPIFSAGLRQIIERWKTGFNDQEVAELQDFAWLCECQDWDQQAFEVTIAPHAAPAQDRAEIDVAVAIGWNETRQQHLSLVREGGEWLIDDIRGESFPAGVRAGLAGAIERTATAGA